MIIDNADSGIYCEGAAGAQGPEIRDNEISGNRAPNGGGILCLGCPAVIREKAITGNTAEGDRDSRGYRPRGRNLLSARKHGDWRP